MMHPLEYIKFLCNMFHYSIIMCFNSNFIISYQINSFFLFSVEYQIYNILSEG